MAISILPRILLDAMDHRVVSFLLPHALQQLLHVGPQLPPHFPLGLGECGERLLVAHPGKVGVRLPDLLPLDDPPHGLGGLIDEYNQIAATTIDVIPRAIMDAPNTARG